MIRVPRYVTRTLYAALQHHAAAAWMRDGLRRRALLHVVLSGLHDPRTGHVLFGAEVMTALRGYAPDRNDVGLRQWLRELRDDLEAEGLGGTFVYSSYSPPALGQDGFVRAGFCTQIERLELPDELGAAFEYDRHNFHRDVLVDVVTGGQHNRRKRIQMREEALDAARFAPDTPAEVARLRDYLHAQSPKAFTDRIAAGKGRVIDILTDIEYDYLHDPDRFNQAASVLRAAILQPVPVYQTGGRTQRLLPYGESMLTGPGWMRRVLLPDCVEADMTSAQLGLVGGLWDVPAVRALLVTGADFWQDLIEHLCWAFPDHRYEPGMKDKVKAPLKGNTYSTCFCMAVENVLRFGNPSRMGPTEYGEYLSCVRFLEWVFRARIEAVGEAFVRHPVVYALLQRREERMEAVEEAGGPVDCFGRAYRVGAVVDGREVTARSAMAAEAQAAEQYVMLGAAEPFIAEYEAKGAKAEAAIMLWQSDGFTFRVRKAGEGGRDRITPWVAAADAGLQARCRELEARLGIPTIHTGFEVKYDPRTDDPDPRAE